MLQGLQLYMADHESDCSILYSCMHLHAVISHQLRSPSPAKGAKDFGNALHVMQSPLPPHKALAVVETRCKETMSAADG